MDILSELYSQFIDHDYTVYEWQIITTFLMFLWFDVFHVGYMIKKRFYKRYWAFIKPWDCRFCTHFWIGAAMSPYFLINGELFEFAIYIIINTLTSKCYDKIFTNTANS